MLTETSIQSFTPQVAEERNPKVGQEFETIEGAYKKVHISFIIHMQEKVDFMPDYLTVRRGRARTNTFGNNLFATNE